MSQSVEEVSELMAQLKEAPFKLLLSYVMDVANILRAGGSKVQGFQLSSLPKVALPNPNSNPNPNPTLTVILGPSSTERGMHLLLSKHQPHAESGAFAQRSHVLYVSQVAAVKIIREGKNF